MGKFKVGDIIERIESNRAGMPEGSIWEVRSICNKTGWLSLRGCVSSYNPHKFTVLSSASEAQILPVNCPVPHSLTIPLIDGVTLLEGKFEASNGKIYILSMYEVED